MHDLYLQGFIDKCAEHGVDPVKLTEAVSKRLADPHGHMGKSGQAAVHPLDLISKYYTPDQKTGRQDFENLVKSLGISPANIGGGLSEDQLAKAISLSRGNLKQALNARGWHASQKGNPYSRFNVVNRAAFGNLFPKAYQHIRGDVIANPEEWKKVVRTDMPKVYQKAYPTPATPEVLPTPAPATPVAQLTPARRKNR